MAAMPCVLSQYASRATYSWAPMVAMVAYRNGLFYLYFGNNAGGGIGVATNANPTGPTNLSTVKVADNGSRGMSATNSFVVTVNPLNGQLSISSIVPFAGTSFNLSITGPTGPDYMVLTSTNLLDWQLLLSTNSASTPFVLTVTNKTSQHGFIKFRSGLEKIKEHSPPGAWCFHGKNFPGAPDNCASYRRR